MIEATSLKAVALRWTRGTIPIKWIELLKIRFASKENA